MIVLFVKMDVNRNKDINLDVDINFIFNVLVHGYRERILAQLVVILCDIN